MTHSPLVTELGLPRWPSSHRARFRFGPSSVRTPQDVPWPWVFGGYRGAESFIVNKILPGTNCDSRMRVAIPLGQSGILEQKGATWRLGGVLSVWRLLTWIFSSESALEPRPQAGRPGSLWRKPLSLPRQVFVMSGSLHLCLDPSRLGPLGLRWVGRRSHPGRGAWTPSAPRPT